MNIIRFTLLIILIFSCLISVAQSPDSLFNAFLNIHGKYILTVDKKINSINEQIEKKSVRYISKFQRHEKKLLRKIEKLNPINSTNSLINTDEKYKEISQEIKGKTAGIDKIICGLYNPYLDSIGNSLSFLKQFNSLGEKVKAPMDGYNRLQSKLNQSKKIKEFIAQRRDQISQLFSSYTKIPIAFQKQFNKLGKTAYYYSVQVKEYTELLKDSKKIEKKAFSILNKLPAFQKFMKQNSLLASMFRNPGYDEKYQSLIGLQTRNSVEALVKEKESPGEGDFRAQIRQNLALAHLEFDKSKDKANKIGKGSTDIELPDFKPDNQKTKSFLQRLEYGADVQFSKNTTILPVTTNIGLSIGYKLNDKSIIGIGLSCKMSMGTLSHLSLSSQGSGLRSYVDWKIKKQFFATGGYEMNYDASLKNFNELKDFNSWQRSFLFGLSKRYKISKKVKSEIKLLYDFLAKTHVPNTQAMIFRFGYKF
jgi:hypothetical protein